MLCLLLVGRKKEKEEKNKGKEKGETARGFFFPGWTCLGGCYKQLKADVRVIL
jgi:hypothetical protein